MRKMKLAFISMVAGTMFLGGCLGGGGFWQRTLWDVALNVGTDFVTDNDNIVDLFADGNTAPAAVQ